MRKIKIAKWKADEENSPQVLYAEILHTTKKATLFAPYEGRTFWIPNSQVEILLTDDYPENMKWWYFNEYEGKETVKIHRFHTKPEAYDKFKEMKSKGISVGPAIMRHKNAPETEKEKKERIRREIRRRCL